MTFRGLVLRPERICNGDLAKSYRLKRQLCYHLTVSLVNLFESKIFIIVVNKCSAVNQDSVDWTIVHVLIKIVQLFATKNYVGFVGRGI